MKLKQALLHNTGWRVITMLFTFLNNILIVRMLGVEESANLFYALAAFTLLSTILRVGLENGIVYFLSKQPDKTKSVFVLLLGVMFLQTIVAIAVLNYFVHEIAGFTFLWCVLFVMANILVYYVSAFYQVKRMYFSLNVSGCTITLIQTILFTYLYFSKSNLLFYLGFVKNRNDLLLLISAAAIIIQMIFLCINFYKQHAKDFTILPQQPTITKAIFGYSFINFGVTVLFFLVLRADLYFVEKYCQKTELSNYLQASKIGQLLLVFPGLIAGVIFPYTINAEKLLAEKVALLCRLLTFLFIIAFICFLIFGPYIFTWLLGKDFNLMYVIFAASFLGIYFLSVSLLLISYFEGINKQSIVLGAFSATFFILIIADYFLVPVYGYLAAALVFSAANFAGIYLLLKTFYEKTGIKMKQLFIIDLKDIKLFKIG